MGLFKWILVVVVAIVAFIHFSVLVEDQKNVTSLPDIGSGPKVALPPEIVSLSAVDSSTEDALLADIVSLPDIVTLNASNFELEVDKFYVTLVMACDYSKVFCSSMALQFKEVSKNFGKDVGFFNLNCTADQELCERYHVKKHSSVMFFKNGEYIGDYSGKFSVKRLTLFAQKVVGFIHPMTLDNIRKTLTIDITVVLLTQKNCPLCKQLKAESFGLKKTCSTHRYPSCAVLEIECDKYPLFNHMCWEEFKIDVVPSIKLLHRGQLVVDVNDIPGNPNPEVAEVIRKLYFYLQEAEQKLEGDRDILKRIETTNPSEDFNQNLTDKHKDSTDEDIKRDNDNKTSKNLTGKKTWKEEL